MAAQGLAPDFIVELSKFPLGECIGEGGFGKVYAAVDPETKKPLAIKILNREKLKGDAVIRFHREVKVLAEFDHETLLRLRGYVPIDNPRGDEPALLMDYMSQGSLQQLINLERSGESPSQWDDIQKLIVLYGIAIGMMILHQHHVIHGDLKPSNVLLNENFEPKVGDFGLSKFISIEQEIEHSTWEGTLSYQAPELHKGLDYGFPVDVYAFGILVYAVVSGKVPYEGMKFPMTALSFKVIEGVRPLIPPTLSSKWKNIMEKCWDPDPNLRPKFSDICGLLSNFEFINEFDLNSISRFKEYQRKVSPPELRVTVQLIQPPWMNDFSMLENKREIYQTHYVRMTLYKEPLTGRSIVVKEYHRPRDPDDLQQVLRRFSREVKMLLYLQHPCVIQIIGYSMLENSGDFRIATEFMPNGSLRDALNKRNSGEVVSFLDETGVAIIVCGFVLGMMFIHAQGAVHRDLKPGSLLLDSNGQPKIASFTTARILEAESELTAEVGTIRYMAPELMDGEGYTNAVDVYSFALILFEILTGKPVWDPKLTSYAIMSQCHESERPSLPPEMNPIIKEIIDQGWQVNPNGRPTFTEIFQNLQQIHFQITPGVDCKKVEEYVAWVKEQE